MILGGPCGSDPAFGDPPAGDPAGRRPRDPPHGGHGYGPTHPCRRAHPCLPGPDSRGQHTPGPASKPTEYKYSGNNTYPYNNPRKQCFGSGFGRIRIIWPDLLEETLTLSGCSKKIVIHKNSAKTIRIVF